MVLNEYEYLGIIHYALYVQNHLNWVYLQQSVSMPAFQSSIDDILLHAHQVK
jgi:hypothetical protein